MGANTPRGVALILLVVVIWVAAGELIQLLETASDGAAVGASRLRVL